MMFRACVASSAIIATCIVCDHATAQTVPSSSAQATADAVMHILPFSRLLTTPGGGAVLTANINTAVAINNSSTPSQQQQAIHDYTIDGALGTSVSDGLGTKLNSIYMNAIVANNPAIQYSAPISQTFQEGNSITGEAASLGKYYFASGKTQVDGVFFP
ncbi:hypothetical protein V5F77_27640, partial [Xanthobacter sp. DSM 24535]|uniref:hypothetical protein n=1 Tax=Roseixanthobacter psychrophilus TaxID=3119917 RepID=UPI003726DEA0